MASLIIHELEQESSLYTQIENDNILNNELKWLLKISMSHLTEEPKFNFKALDTNYAKKSFQNSRFYSD